MSETPRKQVNSKQQKDGSRTNHCDNEAKVPGDKNCNRQSDPCNFLNKKF